MTIVFNVDDLLFELFPSAKDAGDQKEALREELIKYYSYSVYKPQVAFEGNTVIITIPSETIAREKQEYDKVVALASKGSVSFPSK